MKGNSGPVGVFDSGVGGLSVLHDIRALLPHEDLLYAADSAHIPYGSKPRGYIETRALLLSRFLCHEGAKAIVVACNTATAAAAEVLRRRLPVPVVAMEPAVKPAAAATRSGVVGVLATVGTVASARLAALLERFGRDVKVLVQACPGLVEQIEAGALDESETRRLVERYTAPLMAGGADVIVLGCTHYPFIRPLISAVVGPEVALIDTGKAVAQQLSRILDKHELRNLGTRRGSERFWTSGDAAVVGAVVRRLWDPSATVLPAPVLRD